MEKQSWHGFAKGERVRDGLYEEGNEEEVTGVVAGGDAAHVHIVPDQDRCRGRGCGPNGLWVVGPKDVIRLCREPKQPGVFKVGDEVRVIGTYRRRLGEKGVIADDKFREFRKEEYEYVVRHGDTKGSVGIRHYRPEQLEHA